MDLEAITQAMQTGSVYLAASSTAALAAGYAAISVLEAIPFFSSAKLRSRFDLYQIAQEEAHLLGIPKVITQLRYEHEFLDVQPSYICADGTPHIEFSAEHPPSRGDVARALHRFTQPQAIGANPIRHAIQHVKNAYNSALYGAKRSLSNQ